MSRVEAAQLNVKLTECRSERDEHVARGQQLESRLKEIYASSVWRWTRPLRAGGRLERAARFVRRRKVTQPRNDEDRQGWSRSVIGGVGIFDLIIYALKICLDEMRYRLSSFSATASIQNVSDIQRLPHIYSVAVIYVARGRTEEERKSIHIFLKSYKKYSSGLPHKLYVVYKGFETEWLRRQARDSFDVPHVAINLNDENLDLGAYIEVSRMVEDNYVFLLNTHSEIRTANWLEKVKCDACG